MASSSSNAVQEDNHGIDGLLSVVAIGPGIKIWIDKVNNITLVWMKTEGQYPGHPAPDYHTTTWWWAKATSGWSDDAGEQNMEWEADVDDTYWKSRAIARAQANVAQTARKMASEQLSMGLTSMAKRFRTISITETMTEQMPDITTQRPEEFKTTTDNEQATYTACINQPQRAQRRHYLYNQQHPPPVNKLYLATDEDDCPLLSGTWTESDPSTQPLQVHQDPWAAPEQEEPPV
jgi:hypothetical protein